MSEERRSTLNAVLATVLVVSALAGVPATTSAGPATAATPELGIDPDDVLMRIDVGPDGSAAWTIEYRVRLNDENATRAFESIQSDIEENETRFTASFAERMGAAADRAENATGREMEVGNVSVSTSRQQLPREYGVVAYRFTWEGFAARSGDELRIGDALAGLFLDRQTTLLIGWPAEYRPTSVAPTPEERRESAALWSGPTDFGRDEPSVVVTSAPATPEQTATPAPTGTSTPTPGAGIFDSSWLLGLVAIVAIGAVGAVGVAVLRRRDAESAAESPTEATASDDGSGGEGGGSTDEGRPATTESDPEPDPEPPEELLSNEERVLRLVRERGGRMKQQEVAGALDWTDAKTSQVVRSMRDEGQLDAFRLGRENVLTLPDVDPADGGDDGEGADDEADADDGPR